MKLTKKSIYRFIAILILLTFIAGAALYFRPLPKITLTKYSLAASPSQAISLPWPAYGQSALGASGYGLLATNGDQTAVPIASVAKVFTAMAVLKQKPLALGEQGPTITLDNTDVGYYSYYYGNDGSVAKVINGEQISEYQALEALMLPSANNIADSLARWAFGSVEAYNLYANQMVKDLGLAQTTINGASGFSAGTVSSASDLVNIGLEVVNNPILAQIVAKETADIPIAGTVHNVNWLLGVNGVNGIKTGNTNEAGGCYLFSSDQVVDGKHITIVGAIIGAPDLNQSISDAKPILSKAPQGFESMAVIKAGQVAGKYLAPWGQTANAVVANDVSLQVWKGQQPSITTSPSEISGAKDSGAQVGEVQVKYNDQQKIVKLVLDKKITKPSLAWRIFRH